MADIEVYNGLKATSCLSTQRTCELRVSLAASYLAASTPIDFAMRIGECQSIPLSSVSPPALSTVAAGAERHVDGSGEEWRRVGNTA